MNSIKLHLYLLILLAVGGCQDGSNKTVKSDINLEELTIAEIHKSYENGSFDSEDLILKYLERIAEKDSFINAISFINPNAIVDARLLDEEYQKTGILRPLHGIPMIVKDNFNTIGMPTTAGSLALKDFIPNSNATMVQQLLDAGAIIIAKSNMAEWAFSAMHTESSTHGTTRNPYNTDYVPAGSSGGTAAAIASNLAVIGLGTDTGNSIRGPSAHNALVGFRSTMGLTSRYGVIPLYLRNDIAGPMCRTVEDAVRVFDVIAGEDANDTITLVHEYNRPKDYKAFLDNDVSAMRIGVMRQLTRDIDSSILNLFNTAIEDLKGLGIEIVDPLIVDNFDDLKSNQWCDVFKRDLEEYLDAFIKNDTIATLDDVVRIGTTSQYAEGGVAYFIGAPYGRSGAPEIPCEELHLDVKSSAFRNAIEGAMKENDLDAMIYPSWNFRPALIDSFEVQYLGDNSQIIAPHTGLPAFTIPMGYTTGHLPSGLQFLGKMFGEADLISVLHAYEKATQHREVPKL